MLPNQSDIEYLMPILTQYAREFHVVLEVGAGNGNGSTRALAAGIRQALEDGLDPEEVLLVSVDIDPQRPEEFPPESWWRKVSGDSTDWRTENNVQSLMQSLGFGGPKLIFLDTIHTREQMKAELELWSWVAGWNTVWLFHDTWEGGPRNPMVDEIESYAKAHGMEYEDLTTESHGLGKMSRKRINDK